MGEHFPKAFRPETTMRNKLLREMVPCAPYLPRIDEERCSGRTTAIALSLIAWAIQNPGLERKIVDHIDNRHANMNLCDMMDKIIRKLELKFLQFRMGPNGDHYIKYTGWEQVQRAKEHM